MYLREIKNNIKKTLFFSSSIILSTLFFAIYLVTKTECQSLEKELLEKKQEQAQCDNTLKSLNHKKNQKKQSTPKIASQEYDLVTATPAGTFYMESLEE